MHSFSRKRLLLLLFFALSGTAYSPGGASATAAGGKQTPADAAALCRGEIARVEKNTRIPAGLLASIAQVESGHWQAAKGVTVAWPWTVTSRGVGKFYRSKAAAAAAVRRLRKRGIRNIDVGCMQVNLMYHGTAFGSPDEALDPARNIAYAADFLSDLRRTQGSWRKAVGRYHSARPARSRSYATKVYRAWRDERRRIARRIANSGNSLWAAAAGARETARAEWKANLVERRTRFAEWIARRIGGQPRKAAPGGARPSS